MEECIVVSDANIFIDLCDIGLIEDFFTLPWSIHTTDLVLKEVKNPDHVTKLNSIQKKLTVKDYKPMELLSLVRFQKEIHKTCNLSIQDCSILLYCESNGFQLLTGDKVLRTKATARQVQVRGILYIFDELVNNGIISKQNAVIKLDLLKSKNPRLPQKEIERRLSLWNSQSDR